MRTTGQVRQLLILLFSMHRSRPYDALMIVTGFALAAATLTVMLSIPAGIDRITRQTGQSDIALAMAANAVDESSSSLTQEQVAQLSHLPQVALSADGQPQIAPQFLATARLPGADGQQGTVQLRGIDSRTWSLLDDEVVHATARFEPGQRQWLGSATLATQYPMLSDTAAELLGSTWGRAGLMEAGGSIWESELWLEQSALRAAMNRPSGVSSVWIKLKAPGALDELISAAQADPRLEGVRIMGQMDYYQQQMGFLTRLVTAAALGVSLLLGAGAALAITTALDMVLDKRRHQLATLWALGFNPKAIALAVLVDVATIGLLTSLAATALVRAVLDGAGFGTSGASQAVYAKFVIDSGVVAAVLAYTVLLALLGAALPLHRTISGGLAHGLKR
ncbi:FtsX-like permease family protein [Stenotrophomonas sp.]|uniref:FtsX-like permease family protein n=1 Tax=Stenotrophomonas sp. TaxID=69392 RepID=UPI002FC8FCE9